MSIDILIYTTHFKFHCEKNGDIVPGKLNIERFMWALTESQWNPHANKWVVAYMFCFYDKKTSMLHLPRYTLDSFLEFVNRFDVNCIHIPVLDGREISVRLKPGIEDKPEQIDLVEYLSDQSIPVKLLEASTGIGKTYCAIKASLVQIGEVTLIQTSGLTEQWKAEVLKFTKMNEKDIYIIQGANSILRLLKNKKLKPKCFIASLKTLQQYAMAKKYPYDTIMPYADFLIHYGISIRIVDEVHMNFFSNVVIDLLSHVKCTIDLSATYERSSRQGNKIFNLIYPEQLRFGAHHSAKYTKVVMYQYGLTHYMSKAKLMGQNGYMQCKYEMILCNHRPTYTVFIEEVMTPLIQAHFVNYALKNERLLVLTSTRMLAEKLCKSIQTLFPQYDTITFLAEDSDEKYANCDIIVSTIKSSGTGRDIKRLITTINTTSFKAAPLTRQCLGRLRHIPGRETIFVDMFNREIASHCEHRRQRKEIYEQRALSYYETRIN